MRPARLRPDRPGGQARRLSCTGQRVIVPYSTTASSPNRATTVTRSVPFWDVGDLGFRCRSRTRRGPRCRTIAARRCGSVGRTAEGQHIPEERRGFRWAAPSRTGPPTIPSPELVADNDASVDDQPARCRRASAASSSPSASWSTSRCDRALSGGDPAAVGAGDEQHHLVGPRPVTPPRGPRPEVRGAGTGTDHGTRPPPLSVDRRPAHRRRRWCLGMVTRPVSTVGTMPAAGSRSVNCSAWSNSATTPVDSTGSSETAGCPTRSS